MVSIMILLYLPCIHLFLLTKFQSNMTRLVCISLMYSLLVRDDSEYGCIKIRSSAIYKFEIHQQLPYPECGELGWNSNPVYTKPQNDSVIHRAHLLSICVDRVPQYHKLPVGQGGWNCIVIINNI